MCEADVDRIEIESLNEQPDGAADHARDVKNPLQRIFEEAGDGAASSGAIPQSNSETMVHAHIEEIFRMQPLAGSQTLISLTIHMDMGDHLREIKKIVPRGTFDGLVETKLQFKRQWRSELMRLATNRTEILTAIEWDKDKNNSMRSEYSVKKALALHKEWKQREGNGGKPKTEKHKLYTDAFVPNESFNKKADFIEYLKQLVDYLRADNEQLRQQNAFLEAELSRWDVTSYADEASPDQPMPALPAVEVAGQ